jgi:hypothetical protein
MMTGVSGCRRDRSILHSSVEFMLESSALNAVPANH